MPMALGRGCKGLEGSGISPLPDLFSSVLPLSKSGARLWAGEEAQERWRTAF